MLLSCKIVSERSERFSNLPWITGRFSAFFTAPRFENRGANIYGLAIHFSHPAMPIFQADTRKLPFSLFVCLFFFSAKTVFTCNRSGRISSSPKGKGHERDITANVHFNFAPTSSCEITNLGLVRKQKAGTVVTSVGKTTRSRLSLNGVHDGRLPRRFLLLGAHLKTVIRLIYVLNLRLCLFSFRQNAR